MAAPTVPKSKESANLNKLVSKEKSSKLGQKHILCSERHSWPRPSKQVEESILSKLSEILKGLPSIFSAKKTESDSDRNEKARIRAQLQIGTSSVFRSLEHGDLECVLVSGKATPAITVEHIISLGRDKGCPLLCLDELSATFAVATESKCLPLTVGFRRLEEGQRSDFAEVVSLVKAHTTVTPSPDTKSKSGAGLHPPQQMSSVNGKAGDQGESSKRRPIRLNVADEKEILAELKRVFSSALAVTPTPSTDAKKKKKKKKKQTGKKNVKEPFDKLLHPQFEAGKRTVAGAIERDRLDLVLASQEVEDVLVTSPLLLYPEGRQPSKCPPVVILPGLTNTLSEVTSAVCRISFLGIKKLSTLPPDSKQDFKKVLETCLKSVKNQSDSTSETSVKETGGANTSAVGVKTNKTGLEENKGKNDMQVENERGGKDEEEEEEEEEDYSYLYILKKDSKDLAELRSELSSDLEKSKKDTNFSSDFISLSASNASQQSSANTTSNHKKNKSKSSLRNQSSSHPPVVLSATTSGNPSSTRLSERKGESKSINVDKMTSETPKAPETYGFISLSSSKEPESDSRARQYAPGTREAGGEDQTETAMDADDKTLQDFQVGPSMSQDKEKNASGNGTCTSDSTSVKHLPPASTDARLLFSMDRSGAGTISARKRPVSNLIATTGPGSGNFSSKEGNVLGDESLQTVKGKEGIDYLSLDAAARTKHKTKALKRKLDNEQGFISFAYTEANIKTMVSNPSKKRKKKKNK